MNINVAEAANEFLKEIKKTGFGGLAVLRLERESIWHEQYAIFVLQFDIPYNIDILESDYCHSEFEYSRFYDDILKVMKKSFSGCKIEFHGPGNHEYEILGPKYKSFYKKHADRLEEISMESGHVIYKL